MLDRISSIFKTHPVQATAAVGVIAVFATIFTYRKKLKSPRYMDMNVIAGLATEGKVISYEYRGKKYQVHTL